MLIIPVPAPAPAPVVEVAPPSAQLAFTGSSRFAVFADIASITTEPERSAHTVRMRSLQVSREDMLIGGVAYVGGWSWWRFDCAAWTADRLDFASLRADGTEGPVTPERSPPAVIAPSQDASALAATACGEAFPAVEATSARAAVWIGRARLKP
ncbi:hypothetical protein [Brevundimonas phoenicis]|uniref:hypothetical protein n=1 Tax=unclassified Brevundimonas TaxID=2622653 RepID=UPI0039A270A2